MSILIDLPPTMVEQAREYATVQGTTLERMVFDYLTAFPNCVTKDFIESISMD